MTDREVMQMALSTLEGWANYGKWVYPESALAQAKRNTTEAITALRAALAEPVQESAPELHAENERLRAKIERLRAERDALRAALINILPLAEFGAAQQSPPYASGELIEAARAALAAREAK